MKITGAKVIVCCPGRNFVTLKIETDAGSHRPRRRHAQRPRTGGGQLPERPRDPLPDRPRRAPDRRHLAVPLPRRLLAARAGDDERDRGGRHRAVGHQGQGRRHAAVPVAGRRQPRRRDGLWPRQRRATSSTRSTRCCATRRWATRRSARRAACRAWTRSTAWRAARSPTSRPMPTCPASTTGTRDKYLRHTPKLFDAVRAAVGPDIHLLHDVHHRLTPDRGRAPGQGAGALPPVLAGRRHAGREPGGLSR